MKIFAAGCTGFIGIPLVWKLVAKGHQVTALVRSSHKARLLPRDVTIITGTPLKKGDWQGAIRVHDAVINLSGSNIFTRWSDAAKQSIRLSRIDSTANIVAAMDLSRDITLLNASGVGFYGFCGDENIFEDVPAGVDFLARVCRDWEQEALSAQDRARVVLLRIGIVLGKEGGAFKKMMPGFKLGLAGRLGSGKQWFPWIHLEDLINAIIYILENPKIKGPVNLSAPNPVTNTAFTKTLGTVLNRPTFLPVPASLIKLVLGELGSMVLEGCKMIPGVLESHGYKFKYPELTAALTELVHKSSKKFLNP
jgi:uncharacterized protein (TIGR01777 family)